MVRKKLAMATMPKDSSQGNLNDDGSRDDDPISEDSRQTGDVQIALSSRRGYRAIQTHPSDEPFCTKGVGALLQQVDDPAVGRDQQLSCKQLTCSVCGPRIRRQRVEDIVYDFGDLKMHVVTVQDGSKEWTNLHKWLDRQGEDYHRIPTSDGRAVILTTADIGEVVGDPSSYVQKVIESSPVGKRRITSSRAWKGAGSLATGQYKRLGISHLALEDRVTVYEESGCNPREVARSALPEGVERAHDLDLPSDPEGLAALEGRLYLQTGERDGGIHGWGIG
jgi:hypothetical protein